MIPLREAQACVVFDIETNGLLDELDRVHLLTAKVVGSDDVVLVWRHNDEHSCIEDGLQFLMDRARDGFLLAGHNIVKFDIPAIKKVYPWFDLPFDQVFDTMVFSRLKFADISTIDGKLVSKGILPRNLFGRHSLESWGQRMGLLKGEYDGDTRIADEKERRRRKWEAWNPDLELYGIQDAVVTEALYLRLAPWKYSHEAIEIEHEVQRVIARQQRHGIGFNEERAADLYGTLSARRAEIMRQLSETVPGSYWAVGKEFVPKRDNKRMGYVAGASSQPIEWKEFNPTSRHHIARFLTRTYGWEPKKFTETGDPAVDDDVLGKLEYPEAKLLAEMFLIEKRIGMLAEGTQAWMKVSRNGRIHGDVTTNGAVTGRMTHSRPNMAQVPKVGSAYGKECRSLFGPAASSGKVMVGADAAGLELRNLAHFMAKWDGGAYGEAVVSGSSDDGTDVHSLNTTAIGLEPKKIYQIGGRQVKGRDAGKTFIYAYLYGAGDEKVGSIIGKGPGVGRKLKNAFLKQTPALKRLQDAIKHAVKTRGFLRGLDGRILHVRSAHAALNTLLQSAGAVVMKKALLILDAELQAKGYRTPEQSADWDYEFVANVHDEWQIECRKEIADDVGRIAVAAIRQAGEHFGFRCPLDGEFKVGATWADTH